MERLMGQLLKVDSLTMDNIQLFMGDKEYALKQQQVLQQQV